MTLTLDIEHDDTTSTLQILAPDDLGDANTPSLQSARIERALTRQPDATDTAEAVVYRDAWNDIETGLDRTNDRLVIREDGDIVFGGRLADFEREGVVVSVLIDGPKRDAIDAEPSGGNDVFEPQPDSTLVENELLSRVPTVDAGTVETVDNAIAFSESHASPGKSLTKLARDADAELRYRTTDTAFELDYVARLGSDRTAETLSPSSATVLGEPRIREQITEDVTHVRVLGAGEGTAQVEAESVAPEFDPADDRPVYRQRVDKDIQQSDRAQSLAETLVAEHDGAPEYLEVELEVPRQVEPLVGDEFALELPAHEIDTELRVATAERIVDADGDRYRVVLSNRRHTAALTGDEKAVELDSLSEGNAGQVVRDSDSQGFDKLDSGEPQEWFFDYPSEVIGEFEATLRVESQPFRRPASAQGHSHAFSVPEHTHDVSISDVSTSTENTDFGNVDHVFSDADGVTLPSSGEFVEVSPEFSPTDPSSLLLNFLIMEDASNGSALRARLHDKTEGVYYPNDTHITVNPPTDGPGQTIHTPIGKDVSGNTLVWELQQIFATSEVDLVVSSFSDAIGKHTHSVSITDATTTDGGGATSTTTDETTALDPGIVTEDTLTPSNVSVEIGGTTVVSGLDHPIKETVDILGVLSGGSNQITASSDTLGELRTSVTFEAVKNVGDTA